MNPAIERLITFVENGEVLKGKRLHVHEAISTHKDNWNRHFTSSSTFEFVLESMAIRTSGARLMLLGESAQYEIATDFVVQFEEVGENEIVVVEVLSDGVYRKSVLKFG